MWNYLYNQVKIWKAKIIFKSKSQFLDFNSYRLNTVKWIEKYFVNIIFSQYIRNWNIHEKKDICIVQIDNV